MEIKPHNSIAKRTKTKKPTAWWNTPVAPEHFGLSLEERMINVNQLCIDGMNWARNCPSAVKMKQFFNLKGLQKYQWDGLVSSNSEVRRANDFMVTELGNRREYMALIKRFDVGFVEKSIHAFDEDWLAINNYHKQQEIEKRAAIALAAVNASDDKEVNVHLHTSA